MELPIIKTGNFKGIIISKEILERYNIIGKVEVLLKKDYMIIKPKVKPRKNWGKAFRDMHKNGDDNLLM